MRICINVRVFEWTYAIFCHKYGYTNHLFRRMEVGDWYYADFLYKYFSIGFPHFGLGHFNMN